LVAYSFIVGADAKRAVPFSNDLANHYALLVGGNKHPQDLVSITKTVSDCNEKATGKNNRGRNNNALNRDQHHANNGTEDRNGPHVQTGFFEMNNDRNIKQQNKSSGNNGANLK